MITNTGKYIIAKYLLGQTPAYASYMALGCGPKPLDTSDSAPDYSAKENLDFEMFRVPISSRGYVVEDGQSKLVSCQQKKGMKFLKLAFILLDQILTLHLMTAELY